MKIKNLTLFVVLVLGSSFAVTSAAVAQSPLTIREPTTITITKVEKEEPEKKQKAVVPTPTGEMEISEAEAALPIIPFPDPPRLKIDGELQMWLEKGTNIPYSGVHLNPEAVALILSEYHAQRKRGEAALDKQRAADAAVLKFQTGKLVSEMAAERLKHSIKEKASDDEKKRLLKINKDIRDDKSGFFEDILKIGGGVLGGILIGILVVAI